MKTLYAVLILLCLAIFTATPVSWAQEVPDGFRDALAARRERCIVNGKSQLPVPVYIDTEEPKKSELEDFLREKPGLFKPVEKKRLADFVFGFKVKWSDSGPYRLETIKDNFTRRTIYRHCTKLNVAGWAGVPGSASTPTPSAPVPSRVPVQPESPLYDQLLMNLMMPPGPCANALYPKLCEQTYGGRK